jgi:hypothetical protein
MRDGVGSIRPRASSCQTRLAVVHHFAHQLQGLRRQAEVGEAGREPRHPQDAHRVLAEGIGDVAQHALRYVALAVIGIDQPAGLVPGDRVDRQVAPRQILLQRDRWIRADGKAAVAARRLAFGPGQRIFLAGLRMQEHREVLADRQVALRDHCLGCGADHHPVVVIDGQAQQGIPYRTAHHVCPHGGSLR